MYNKQQKELLILVIIFIIFYIIIWNQKKYLSVKGKIIERISGLDERDSYCYHQSNYNCLRNKKNYYQRVKYQYSVGEKTYTREGTIKYNNIMGEKNDNICVVIKKDNPQYIYHIKPRSAFSSKCHLGFWY